jgi:tetratricopeptide (TPR) repeat protein
MQQVLVRAIYLLRRPPVILAAAVMVVGGVSLVTVPLFNLPGYELALALSIGTGVFGGVVGATAAFQERRVIQGRNPRPPAAVRRDSAIQAAFLAGSAAIVLNLALLLPAFLASVIHALTSTACDPFAQLGFFPLLPLPSAILASGAGAFSAFATRRKLSATFLYAAFLLGSLGLTLWPVVMGPQAFVYNHFLGYLPGPLYDEALSTGWPLVWFRLQTLLISALLWVFTATMLDMREGRLTRPHLRPAALGLVLVLGAAIVHLERRAPELGFRMTYARLEERLGGLRESEHFRLVYPRGMERLQVDRLIRELEFRHAQLSAFLGGAPRERIRVFLYRSAEEKAALVGAAQTQFAKPWLLETHVDRIRSLKHELAHVMASPYGTGPFKVTTRYGVWPSMGVVEGLAVAADNPADELTLHQWAAGMRRQSLAPDVRQIIRPQGFFQNAPARAYTLVGSFLRYLAETYGAEKLRALYARGDFESSYGRSLEALATEWEKFLDGLPLDEAQVAQAFARFRQGSLFARPCAREVAAIEAEAAERMASDPAEALRLYRRCAELQPDEPSFQLEQAQALTRLDRGDEATELLKALAAKLESAPALRADVLLAHADIAAQLGRDDEAAALLKTALELRPAGTVDRTARVKLAALQSPTSGKAIFDYLRPGRDEAARLLRLREALDREPDNASLAYLLGRRVQAESPRMAARYLSQALARELPDSLRREALRLKVEALYLAGDCDGVRHEAGQLPDLGAALKARVTEWVERCEFEERTFQGPLSLGEAFR